MQTHVAATWFSNSLLKWFEKKGRHDLPWKKPLHAYRVWISEIMLQQTQVSTVIPYFERFVISFPTVQDLANAPLDLVLHHWSGLGYYARARNLHQCAKIIVTEFKGKFPKQREIWETLPGIGRSTAAAIVSQAFNTPAAILDANVKRVLSRFNAVEGWYGQKRVSEQFWHLAEFYTPSKNVGHYTQAIMDLGATCCTRSRPQCQQCPLQKKCIAFNQGQVALYPTAKPKKVIPTKKIIMLAIRNKKGDILLEQRPLKGIWAGLWSLPEFAEIINLQNFIKNNGIKSKKLNNLPVFKHTFTHYHLEITPKHLILDSAVSFNSSKLIWVKKAALLQRGLPAPIKIILEHCDDTYRFL